MGSQRVLKTISDGGSRGVQAAKKSAISAFCTEVPRRLSYSRNIMRINRLKALTGTARAARIRHLFQYCFGVPQMYAVIATGGKQYRVTQGQTLRVEKLAGEEGATVKLDKVLMVADGDKVSVGTPTLDKASVTATIKAQGRGDKVEIIKFRRRKHSRTQMGHRQSYTEIEVTDIKA